jgi:hypothetical protein
VADPRRIQRQRTKGWRMPEGAVYVGRPSRWGNPFVLGETYMWLGATGMPFPVPSMRDPGEYDHGIRAERLTDPARAVEWFRAWVSWTENAISINVLQLHGKDLACWCPLDQPCHADVLLELARG